MTTKEFEQKIKRVLITEEEIQAKVRKWAHRSAGV